MFISVDVSRADTTLRSSRTPRSGDRLEMMIEVVGHPLALADRDLHLNLILIIETFSICILYFLYLRLNSSQSRLSLGCVNGVAV